jgi:hypothetical protein
MKTLEQIKSILEKKKYPFFDNGKPYNLNLIGVRHIGSTPNKFDDEFYCIYRDETGKWQIKCYQCTTDPGIYWLNNPMNIEGAGIMVEGHYQSLWKEGLHQGKYPALVQNAPVKLYRDKDKDSDLDMDEKTIVSGMFGVNCHHAGVKSAQVDKWSAACQVFANISDWDNFRLIAYKYQYYFPGAKYSYTLLNEKDFYL